MTAAAITSNWTFRGLRDCCTAKIGHSAERSHETTKVRGIMQIKGSSHGLLTDDLAPSPSVSRWRSNPVPTDDLFLHFLLAAQVTPKQF